MKKRTLSAILIVGALFASIFLFGCKNDKIIFKRDSQAASLIEKFSISKQQTTKSSGVIILKDEKNGEKSINFGPRDIDFDMPQRFK